MVAVFAARFQQSLTRPWKQDCRLAARTVGSSWWSPGSRTSIKPKYRNPAWSGYGFHIHVGQCRRSGQRVQGRHARQTSDAVGSAASQLGARAAAWALSRHCSTMPGVLLLWQSRHAWPSADGTSNCNQQEWEKTEHSCKAHGNLRSTTFLLQSYPQLPSCLWPRNCTSSVINAGNPGALIRSSLTLAVGTQFNKWRSRNSVSARASEMAVVSSDACSQV